MYPVSEAFLQAVQENTRRYHWTGRITTKKADAVERETAAKGIIVIPSAEPESEEEGQSIEVELPVIWTEDGNADVIFTFEFNDEEILIHC